METFNSETINNIRENTRKINELLNNYKSLEEEQSKSRDVKTYHVAGEQMKHVYNMIVEEINKMLSDVDLLGVDCGAIKLTEFK